MFEGSVPELEWKSGVCAAEDGDEVIFESADGSFGGVAAMAAGWGQLEIDINRI